MSRDIIIMGIMVDNRSTHGPEVQEVLTRYRSSILCRAGIPDPTRERGIISLTMQADEKTRQSLQQDLQKVPGVKVNSIPLGDPL
jgi:putative iron-only hydrogenase system regulator